MDLNKTRAATAKEMQTKIEGTVYMATLGNPDSGQDPSQRLPHVPCMNRRVTTLEQASTFCGDYIEKYNFGGGNWAGGQVLIDGQLVAQVSYNGRVWVFDHGLEPAPAPAVEHVFVLKATTSDGDGVSEYFVVSAVSLETAIQRLGEEFPGAIIEEAALKEAYRGGIALLNDLGSAEL